MMTRLKLMFLASMLCLLPMAAQAGVIGDWWLDVTTGAGNAWNSNKYELLVPLRTYHVRASYSKHNIDKYNEAAWGIGLEKYYTTDANHRHSLFAFTFQDSYNRPEPTIGYSWQKMWYWNGDANNLGAGLGYALALTFRGPTYFPLPAPLPMGTIDYQRLSLQAGWVPYMGHNDGNVFLLVGKWKFELG